MFERQPFCGILLVFWHRVFREKLLLRIIIPLIMPIYNLQIPHLYTVGIHCLDESNNAQLNFRTIVTVTSWDLFSLVHNIYHGSGKQETCEKVAPSVTGGFYRTQGNNK